MDSRLRRFPPDRASAVPYGQTVDNAARCPPLAHRSAAAHKLHGARSNLYKIRESQNQNPGTGLSLFLPGGCPNHRDHRIGSRNRSRTPPPSIKCLGTNSEKTPTQHSQIVAKILPEFAAEITHTQNQLFLVRVYHRTKGCFGRFGRWSASMSDWISATAVIGGMSRERRHLFALPPFVGGRRKTLAPRVRATAYRKSLLTLSVE